MISDACKLLVAALLLINQHVCRCSRPALSLAIHNVDPATAQGPGNKAGRFYHVKSGVNSFFRDQVLLEQLQQAVQLVIPLLVEGNLRANLHVLRCTEAGEAIPNWTRRS
ncbi:TPA: hypothetical protein ACH3X1_015808 [Trebouxia sp. C0004]